MDFKSGFVTVVGKPNAGKSTLINALCGHKVSIVSPKPQTTRNKILGIFEGADFQIVFADTPGFVRSTSAMNKFMANSIRSAAEDAEVILYVLDASRGITEDDINKISSYAAANQVFLALNKSDLLSKEDGMQMLTKLSEYKFIKEIIPLSALKGKNIDSLRKLLIAALPSGPRYFPEGTKTDKPIAFLCAELIREKLLYHLSDEIPHGVGVTFNKFVKEGSLFTIDADIVCERAAHKAIIIGKGGQKLKAISTDARMGLERLLDTKVFLTVWVRVKENWRESEMLVKEIGYKED